MLRSRARSIALLLFVACQPSPDPEVAATAAALEAPPPSVGTFAAAPPSPWGGGANSLLLLSDGSVLVNGDGDWQQWARLVPDAHGSYANGTWSPVFTSRNGRLYYPEFLLPDGRVFLGGGEYIENNTVDSNQTELFDPQTNTFSAGPPGLLGDIGDVSAVMLADGRILLGHRFTSQTQIYDPAHNAFTMGASMAGGDSGSEGGWQLLSDGSVLASIRTVQRYLPASNTWVTDKQPPFAMSSDSEQGPVTLLEDGRVFACSDRQFAGYFTPPATAGATGSWTTAASLPGGAFGDDVPAALLPSGKVLLEGTAGEYGNLSLFELDPTANSYASVPTPLPPTLGYTTRMLMLPTGQVLFAGPPGGGATGFYVYTPTGAPQDAWRPVINSVAPNADGSFTVTGTQLNGRSYGAVYGDDSMSSSNYPIVSLTDGAGHVFHARSYQFSSMGVRTGSAVVSARFRLPAGLATGSYSLFVSAAGISSAAFPFSVGASTTLAPAADAHVRSGAYAAQNFGTATTMEIKLPTSATVSPDNTRRAFLRFDLSSVSGAVSSAKLRLYGSHPTDTARLSAFAVADNGWGEGTITFNQQPALGAKQGASVPVSPTAGYYEWDVTAFAASQKAAGAGAVSLAVTMDAGDDAGPAVFKTRESASNRPQLVVVTSGAGGNAAPTIATPASATPNPVTGTSTALSVLGADDGGEAALIYTWSATGPASVAFSANASNAAKSTTATFSQAGSYTLAATVTDAGGLAATSSVTVIVRATKTLAPVADAYVRDGSSAMTNFGKDLTLVAKNTTAVGTSRRTFLRFDLGGFSGKVTKAKLRLYGSHPSGTTQDSAYATTDSWTETGLTWNNQPALGTKQSSVSITTTAKYYEWDVTAFVSSQKAANKTAASLAVTMDTVTTALPDTFNSREATTNKPQLVVTYGP